MAFSERPKPIKLESEIQNYVEANNLEFQEQEDRFLIFGVDFNGESYNALILKNPSPRLNALAFASTERPSNSVLKFPTLLPDVESLSQVLNSKIYLLRDNEVPLCKIQDRPTARECDLKELTPELLQQKIAEFSTPKDYKDAFEPFKQALVLPNFSEREEQEVRYNLNVIFNEAIESGLIYEEEVDQIFDKLDELSDLNRNASESEHISIKKLIQWIFIRGSAFDPKRNYLNFIRNFQDLIQVVDDRELLVLINLYDFRTLVWELIEIIEQSVNRQDRQNQPQTGVEFSFLQSRDITFSRSGEVTVLTADHLTNDGLYKQTTIRRILNVFKAPIQDGSGQLVTIEDKVNLAKDLLTSLLEAETTQEARIVILENLLRLWLGEYIDRLADLNNDVFKGPEGAPQFLKEHMKTEFSNALFGMHLFREHVLEILRIEVRNSKN